MVCIMQEYCFTRASGGVAGNNSLHKKSKIGRAVTVVSMGKKLIYHHPNSLHGRIFNKPYFQLVFHRSDHGSTIDYLSHPVTSDAQELVHSISASNDARSDQPTSIDHNGVDGIPIPPGHCCSQVCRLVIPIEYDLSLSSENGIFFQSMPAPNPKDNSAPVAFSSCLGVIDMCDHHCMLKIRFSHNVLLSEYASTTNSTPVSGKAARGHSGCLDRQGTDSVRGKRDSCVEKKASLVRVACRAMSPSPLIRTFLSLAPFFTA
jgi:hypothetical protein